MLHDWSHGATGSQRIFEQGVGLKDEGVTHHTAAQSLPAITVVAYCPVDTAAASNIQNEGQFARLPDVPPSIGRDVN